MEDSVRLSKHVRLVPNMFVKGGSKTPKWSYSRIGIYATCNRRYYYQYILRLPQPASDFFHMHKGRLLHYLIECDLSGIVFDPKHKDIYKDYNELVDAYASKRRRGSIKDIFTIFEKFKASIQYRVIRAEFTAAKLKGTEYNLANMSGQIDCFYIYDNVLKLHDWKSGKSKVEGFGQLNTYSYDLIEWLYDSGKLEGVDTIELNYTYIEDPTDVSSSKIMSIQEFLYGTTERLIHIKKQIDLIEVDTEWKRSEEAKRCDQCYCKDTCRNDKLKEYKANLVKNILD